MQTKTTKAYFLCNSFSLYKSNLLSDIQRPIRNDVDGPSVPCLSHRFDRLTADVIGSWTDLFRISAHSGQVC